MNRSETAKVIASAFALSAFAVAIIAGLSAGNSTVRILGTALVSMVVCHAAGLAIGAVGQRVVNEHLQEQKPGDGQAGSGAAVSPPTG